MAESGVVKRRKSVSSSVGVESSSAAASATAAASKPAATAAADDDAELNGSGYWGFTEDNTRFAVPETLNTTQIFYPQNISVGSGISLACFLTSAYLVAFGGYSKWLHIGIFFFFRLAYDVGLGVILRAQSEHKSFQKWYLRHYGDGTSWKARLFDHLAERQLSVSVRTRTPIRTYPQVFRAWLVYKNLVNIVLVNDGLTYILLGIKCFHFPPSDFSWWVIAQYLVGLGLALFNWWAKVDAHRCIGSYCWYWGDFFFRKDLHLTFDGIFELFPHPMYTVGYSLYYGYSLIARSYTMLFVSLVAHGLQLAFLFFVEEPHIKRTYGAPPSLDKTKGHVLYDPKSGWFPDKSDNVFLANFDLFRSGDFSVAFFSIYAVALAFLPADPWWAMAQVVLWRIIHWVGLGAVLWSQSHFQLWTRHFTTRGRTIQEAFAHWKNTYNLSLTLNQVVFVACALRYAQLSFATLFSAYSMACVSLGCVLILLSVWSYSSTYEAVGDFGWFYGDFFISGDAYKAKLIYDGIYRFLNNPDCVTGCAGQYGLALLAQSWPVFFLALGSHLLNILFLNLVEIPHMNKLYSDKEIRTQAPFPKALKRIQKTVGLELPPTIKAAQTQLERNFRDEVRKVRNKALEEVLDIYKKVSDGRKGITTDKTATVSVAFPASPASLQAAKSSGGDVSIVTPPRIALGESLAIQFSAPVVPREAVDNSARPRAAKFSNSKSSYDWIGVFPVDVASSPGVSDGKWVYVEPSLDGSVVFPSTLLPSQEGVYEVRYHRNNSYVAVASHPFILADEIAPSPLASPMAEDAATATPALETEMLDE